MALGDYLKARCELYRTPSLDLSPLMGLIEQQMVDAWQMRYNPQQLLEKLTANKQIRSQLAAQVEDHLLFREREESRKINEACDEAQSYIKSGVKSKLDDIKHIYGQREASLTTRVEQADVEQAINQTNYQTTVNEIEIEKQKALETSRQIGGASALENILSINDAILAESGINHTYNTSDDDALASTILETQDAIDPLRKPNQYNKLVKDTEKKTKRAGVFHRMFNILTFGWYK